MNSRIVATLGLALQLAATHVSGAQVGMAKADSAASSAAGNAVVAQEQAVLDAISRSDTVAFNKALGRDFVYVDQNGAVQWHLAQTATMLHDCGLGTGWTLDHPRTTVVGSDLVVLTYSSSGKAQCNGRTAPSPVNSMSVWRRTGGRWVAVAHSETPAAPSAQKP